MFLNPEELRLRASSPDNLVNSIEFRRLNNGGKNVGDKNRDDETRAQIGALAQLLPLKDVAEAYDASIRSVSCYKAGEVSPGVPSKELAKLKEKKEDKIADKAADILLSTLGGLEDLNLNNKSDRKKGKDVASIAKSLSDIHFKLSGGIKRTGDPELNKARVVIYAPNMKSLNDYGEVIEASASTE